MTRALTALFFAFASTPAFAGIGYDATDISKGFGDSTLWYDGSDLYRACEIAEDLAVDRAIMRADRACGGEAVILFEDVRHTSERLPSANWYFANCSAAAQVTYTCQ